MNKRLLWASLPVIIIILGIVARPVIAQLVTGLELSGGDVADVTCLGENLSIECGQVGLDCIPLVIEHVPVGPVEHRDDRDLGGGGNNEFDISPAGEVWIVYPN